MKEKKASRLLKTYMSWPVVAVLIMVVTAVCVYVIDPKAGVAAAAGALLGLVIMLILYFAFKSSVQRLLVGVALETEEEQARLVRELDIPFLLVDGTGAAIWCNKALENTFSGGSPARLEELFPEITAQELASIEEEKSYRLSYRERKYRVVIRESRGNGSRYAVYLYDETALVNLTEKYENDRTVIGLVYLDNYEEATESVEEVQRSLLIALIDRKVNSYFADVDGIVKKLEKDKYLFLIKNMYLSHLEQARFDLLEEVKTVNIGNEIRVTCSIGVGHGSETISGNYEFARTAIDMALARGGDQAVIKEAEAIRYYGGKSQSIEKATRVKARVKAQAFKEILSTKDRLIVMGHAYPDIDCIGAAMGLWRVASVLGKKANIVVGEIGSSIRPMMDRIEAAEYPADLFIDKATALGLVDSNTVLAVVDVNKPVITEAPELLDVAESVVVFDHHRQGSQIIDQAVLSYVEPYASSTCEMVAEVTQYIADDLKLRTVEADAMYGGIVIDTNNFTNQTGVRTFEAAAYLRKQGADVTRVRKLFRDSVEDYRAKADAVHNAEIFRGAFAISECNGEGLESPTIVGAQAANDLLDIDGIQASIVLTRFRDQVFVSARSIDEVNVQILMERLGGGGHRSIAGAQLKDVTLEEARTMIKEIITEMSEGGEL